MRTRRYAVSVLVWTASITSCTSDLPPAQLDAGRPSDASEPAFDADAPSADTTTRHEPSPDTESDPADREPPRDDVRDARLGDAVCQTCDPPGGQYCGTIGDGCSRRTLMCGPECRQPGFSCGGGGINNVCGAAPDSGLCTKTVCQARGGSYCGPVGDGCGDTLDCGECPIPLTCGAGGTPGVCGAAEDTCTRLTCTHASARYCGVIGNGCGGSLDCGWCPEGDVCGVTIEHMCGLDPPGILVPPPAPELPPPPGPPRPNPPPPN